MCLRVAIALVDTLGAKFVWQYTFERAIHGFRNAVLAYGQSIKAFIANRTFTNQKKKVPEFAVTRFGKLVEFHEDGKAFNPTSAFDTAIKEAEEAADEKRTGVARN
jgi:isocitrate dehydrogenase kinase/phosphatase